MKWRTKIIILTTVFTAIVWLTSAQDINLSQSLSEKEIKEVNRRIDFIWSNPWDVNTNIISGSNNLSFRGKFTSWIINRDFFIEYLIHVVKILSQLWFVAWAIFIIIAGYKYMLSVFNWWKADSRIVKNAIIWVIIIIFSYAILKFFTAIFLWS